MFGDFLTEKNTLKLETRQTPYTGTPLTRLLTPQSKIPTPFFIPGGLLTHTYDRDARRSMFSTYPKKYRTSNSNTQKSTMLKIIMNIGPFSNTLGPFFNFLLLICLKLILETPKDVPMKLKYPQKVQPFFPDPKSTVQF